VLGLKAGTSILQSGYPFTVFTDASFTGGGDYNADGDNLDFPNAASAPARNIQECVSDRRVCHQVSSLHLLWARTETNKVNQFRNPEVRSD